LCIIDREVFEYLENDSRDCEEGGLLAADMAVFLLSSGSKAKQQRPNRAWPGRRYHRQAESSRSGSPFTLIDGRRDIQL